MSYLKDIVGEIEEILNLKSIVGAYEEIASMKMRKIRGVALNSRDFIEELTDVYREVTISSKNQILLLLQEKKIASRKNLSVKTHNGKIACVFLSANSGLFGDILQRTYRKFLTYLEQHDAEPVIIGNFGKKIFESQFPERKFVFFSISDNEGQRNILEKITDQLIAYENVIIFYAKFKSMESQDVATLDLEGQEKPLTDKPIPSVHYLFEPSLEGVLDFFEKEIFANIFEQTYTESELARYASRMIALDIATSNIDKRLKVVELTKNMAEHRELNKKQLAAINGISLWKIA